MTKGRDIAADSIGDLLEVARAQQRSGMLRTEYSQGGRLEEGEIYVLAGQPIYARTGRLLGNEALRRLLGWRNIYFSFVSDAPRPKANLTAALHLGSMSTTGTLPTRQTQPFQSPTPMITPPRSPVTGQLTWRQAEQAGMAIPPARPSTPGLEKLIPQKVGPERDADTLTLSRRQRLVYFLVDGKRSVGDLTRTANKNQLEVELILSELQELGLIAI